MILLYVKQQQQSHLIHLLNQLSFQQTILVVETVLYLDGDSHQQTKIKVYIANKYLTNFDILQTAGPLAPILQWKSVQIISNQECVNYHLTGGTAGMIVDEKICALSPGGMGSCTGDSGSSLTRDGLVYGLISWGVGCDSTLPDIYTRVFSYDSWITATAV